MFSGLDVLNNTITSIDGTAKHFTNPFGSSYSVGIAALASPSATSPTVTIQGNQIEGASGSGFGRGIWLNETEGTIGGNTTGLGNTVVGYVQDLLDAFAGGASGGSTTIENNNFGGVGVTITQPNANAPIAVSDNTFDSAYADDAQLTIRNNYNASSPITVSGNAFTVPNASIGLVSAASIGVSVLSNTFTPAGSAENTVDIDVDTQNLSDAVIAGSFYNPNSISITGNAFNAGGSTTATAIEFADNASQGSGGADFGAITIGGSGANANTFDASLKNYIVLAPSAAAVSYSGDVYNTYNSAAVSADINASQNSFGGTTPAMLDPTVAANLATFYGIDDKIVDGVDYSGAGLVSLHAGYLFVTPNSYLSPATNDTGAVARAVALASSGNLVSIEDGTYLEANVTLTTPVTIQGQSQAGVTIAPSIADDHTNASFGTSSGAMNNAFVIQSSGVTIEDLTVDGNANSTLSTTENFRAGVIVNYNTGEYDNTVVNDATFNNIYRRGVQIYDVSGARTTTGNAVIDSTFTNVGDNAALGGSGYAIVMVQSSGDISGNTISNTETGIATNFSTQWPSFAPTINITDNTISDLSPLSSGAVGIYAAGLTLGSTIDDNEIDTTGQTAANESDYGIILSYLSDYVNNVETPGGALDVQGNTIKSDGADIGVSVQNRSFGVSAAYTPVAITSNTIEYLGATPNLASIGVQVTDNNGLSSDDSAATFSGNTITGYGVGAQIQNAPRGGHVDSTQAIFTGTENQITAASGGIGVQVVGTGATASIAGATISGGLIGVEVEAGATASIDGTTFSGNSTDVKIAAGSSLTSLTNDKFTATTTYIDNESSGYVDATTDSFGGVLVSSLSVATDLASLYALENQITDGLDVSGAGLVRLLSGDVFLAASSEAASPGSLQRAVNLAASADTVYVQAGTYVGNVIVNNPVALIGPNTNLAGYATGRVAEAIIEPDVSGANPYSAPLALVEVLASNVTIDGFTLTGQNDTLGGAGNANAVPLTGVAGTYAQAAVAISSYELNSSADLTSGNASASIAAPTNLVIQNNVIEDVSYIGVDLGRDSNGTASSDIITKNVIQNIGAYNDEGSAVRLYNDAYTSVTNNVISNVRMGVELENFYQAPLGGDSGSVANNTIDARRRGVFYNNFFSAAAAVPVEYNTISAVADDPTIASSASLWTGVYIISQENEVAGTFLDNSIDGVGSSYGLTAGYTVINTLATTSISISGDTNSLNSIKNVTYGVWITSGDPNGLGGAATGPIAITLDGASISNVTDGVYVDEDPSNLQSVAATIEGNTAISDTATGVLVSGASASLTFSGPTAASLTSISGDFIELEDGAMDGAVVDASNVSFSGGSLSSFVGSNASAVSDLALFYALEGKIADGLDADGLGLVRLKSGDVFVAASSEAASAGSLERAVNLATSGDTIYVQAGSYASGVVITKALTLEGAQAGVDPTAAGARSDVSSESLIYAAASGRGC